MIGSGETVQQNPKPGDGEWANYWGIYALCSYGSDDLAMLFLFLTLFPIYFVLCIMPIIVFSCCFSPDMFNPTTQSSLDVFLLLQRVPRERSKEGRCI